MIKQHKIYFNSKDRITGTSTNLNYKLATTIPNVLSMSITDVRMPITYYNVNNKNNTMKVIQGTTTHNIVIENKNYSASALGTTLKTQLDSGIILSAPHSVNYDSNTGKFTIVSSTNISILEGGLARFIGFTKNTTTGLSHTSDVMGNFAPSPSYIMTDLGTNTELNGQLLNIVYTISGNVSFGSIMYDNEKNVQPIELLKKKNIGHLKFSLVDGDGDVIDNNGVDYSMIITLYYIENDK